MTFILVQAAVNDDEEYIAFAFSRDDGMGDDNAMVCTINNVEMYWTFNMMPGGRGADKLADPQLGISSSSVSGWKTLGFKDMHGRLNRKDIYELIFERDS